MSTTPPGAAPTAPDAPEHAARAQSLAQGTVGAVLLHVERACRNVGSWDEVHTLLTSCVHNLLTDETAGLYVGAPSVAFALHLAATGTGRYTGALQAVDTEVAALTRRRLRRAHARIESGEHPRVGEFDLFYGLTGLGSYLLRRDPHAPLVREVLAYLVRLTLPLPGDHDQRPGWWTPLDPTGRVSEEFAGGHGNLGMAHGITGPLALLSTATRHGVVVQGQAAAVKRICGWLDAQRQDAQTGVWWPQWVTLAEHRTRTVVQSGPNRPSWCYGTPGLARAQQLAGLALGDAARRRMAEDALLTCLSDPAQLSRIRDASLCHGAAGLLHTAHRIARDAPPGMFAAHLPQLRVLLQDQDIPREPGLLEGSTGPALALLTAETDGTTVSGWDACLLSH